MPFRPSPACEPPSGIAPVPSWIASGAADTLENASFRAGAALAYLHPVATGQAGGGQATGVPLALLRDRLALAAAEACITRAGGRARAPELRDRIGFLAPDARMDPETAQFDFWRRAVSASLRGDVLLRLLPEGMAEAGADIGGTTAGGGRNVGEEKDGLGQGDELRGGKAKGGETGDPVSRAVRVLERLRWTPPDRMGAVLMLADAALARALGWPALLPLLATGLSRRDLALEDAALRQACCGAVVREVVRAVRLAADLARRAARLRAVAPKLRAKASDAAVARGSRRTRRDRLARDAVAPTMDLSPVIRGSRVPMSPRAAARLCDRLVDLGAVSELTGRATFRLYGL